MMIKQFEQKLGQKRTDLLREKGKERADEAEIQKLETEIQAMEKELVNKQHMLQLKEQLNEHEHEVIQTDEKQVQRDMVQLTEMKRAEQDHIRKTGNRPR